MHYLLHYTRYCTLSTPRLVAARVWHISTYYQWPVAHTQVTTATTAAPAEATQSQDVFPEDQSLPSSIETTPEDPASDKQKSSSGIASGIRLEQVVT